MEDSNNNQDDRGNTGIAEILQKPSIKFDELLDIERKNIYVQVLASLLRSIWVHTNEAKYIPSTYHEQENW
jgi:hypothetical protein